VADAMRADAASIGDMPDGMIGIWRAARLPESLASLEEKMTAQLEAVRRVKAAVDPLYEALSDDQKKTADELDTGADGSFLSKPSLRRRDRRRSALNAQASPIARWHGCNSYLPTAMSPTGCSSSA
jgi:hypothetical protein